MKAGFSAVKVIFPSASVVSSSFSKLIFPSAFDAGYSSVRLKFSAAVPSAFVTEKTKASAKLRPSVISFGDETLFIEMPSRDSIKSSSGLFCTVKAVFSDVLYLGENYLRD